MTKTVAKITHKGVYGVVYDDSKRCNPYTIYKEFYAGGHHKQKIAEYSDMTSCLYHIAEEFGLYDR